MGKTQNALMARGVDAATASQLEADGHLLKDLQQRGDDELQGLGLHHDAIAAIRRGPRPPIPEERLQKVLYESRWTCCVCRASERSVVVHHIDEWSESHSHEESNLVVLCLEHHDKAHSKSELSLNLTPDRIRDCKRRWLEEARRTGLRKSLSMSWMRDAIWDYFNHHRLNEIAFKRGLDVGGCNEYNWLVDRGVINRRGVLIWKARDRADAASKPCLYLINAEVADRLQRFEASVLERLSETRPLRRIDQDVGVLGEVVPGTLVVWTGEFSFKRENRRTTGAGQLRRGRLVSDETELQFVFDAWEALGTSAHGDHLSGRARTTGFFVVRGVAQEQRRVDVTCLAIGFGCAPRPGAGS